MQIGNGTGSRMGARTGMRVGIGLQMKQTVKMDSWSISTTAVTHHKTSTAHTVLVKRNFTKSADCPRRKSAGFPRHRRGYPRNRARVSAESCKGVRGIVSGCPRNR